MNHIYTNLTASISEFKKSPTALLAKSSGELIALLNHNKPTAYLVPAELYEQMVEILDDRDLLKLAEERLKEKKEAIAVDLNDL
ncbi:type II toxin-antitoxin system Phd/YefM family antitoxin [Candidatus Tisiphia endosymbiont of Dascillus cervinus]|uniref:type II toxin-antitoxin system Phd/YefM family antitoxin n=1 Tax=Candidatus Tisiphia endosymbiont of Dascillus cervinus TaxID=3066253 RepID=UPI00312CBCB4